MATISEYPLHNTGQQIQTAIDEALDLFPYQISLKANTADVLTKTNTIAYTPTADYHPATKKYVDDGIPTVDVGQTTTGAEGTDALVTNSGTNRRPILNFTIPRGDKGDAAGFDTPTAAATTLAPGSQATATVVASGASTNKKFAFTFGIPQGIQGVQGVQGYYVNSVIRTSGSGQPGTTDTYTMYLNDAGGTSVGTFNVYNGLDGNGSGSVTSVAVDSSDSTLTVSGSPITTRGTISIGHSNNVTAKTTQAVYPITFDSHGHITGAGSALDLSNKEDISNKVTTVTSASTNTQYPSALAVYTLFTSIINGDEVAY